MIAFGDTQMEGSKIKRSAFYNLSADDEGMRLIINYPQSLDERIEHAVSEMHILAQYQRSINRPIKVNNLVSEREQARPLAN